MVNLTFQSESMLEKWLKATRKEYGDDKAFKNFLNNDVKVHVEYSQEYIESLSGLKKEDKND